jgi:GH35 family endo-1,4-beta-xylanase
MVLTMAIPDVNLYLNDYDILTGKKLPEYMAQIRSLLKQGVPIAGIGVQGHLTCRIIRSLPAKTCSRFAGSV